MNRKKDLSTLLKDAGLSWTGPAATITGLIYDSRHVKKGDLFFAMRGVHVDGHNFVKDVGQKGATAALVEELVPSTIPLVVVPSVQNVMSSIAVQFFDHPSQKIPVVGVTGTNGKTTVTYLIEDILRINKKTCGVMGTVNYRFNGKVEPAPNTTPMAVDVQRFLAEVADAKADAAVMEVSSHALALQRVEDVSYRVGVFMNLTQDHLDYHKTMENYFLAKASLFKKNPKIKAVINQDDPYGVRLLKECSGALSFGIQTESSLMAKNIQCNLNGIHFDLKLPSGSVTTVATNLMGLHNVSNCLASAGACLAMGLSEDEVAKGLNQPHAIPGRLERIEAGQDFVVVVDFAHTHDALEKVLTALKETGPKNIYCVFGAGGDRDRTKRPKMGRVAVTLATHVFLTSDNPRSEEPRAIIQDIEAGIKEIGKSNYTVYVEREEAIRAAIRQAKTGDIVLLAGKGHETSQIIGTTKFHFSDQQTARKVLSE